MNGYMLEEFHNDPALLRRRISAEAHRQRAQAVGDAIAWLFGSVGRAFSYVKGRFTARPAGWIARLG